MITTINAKQLAIIYKMGYSTLQQYLSPHRKELQRIATKRIGRNGNVIQSNNYNSMQLKYIAETIMGDNPEDFVFDGETFIKRITE